MRWAYKLWFNRIRYSFVILIVVSIVVQFFFFAKPAYAWISHHEEEVPVVLSQDWMYRWGTAAEDSSEWKPMKFPGQPHDRSGSRFLWLKAQMPQCCWSDASLLIISIHKTFEVYIDGKLIYRYGNLNNASADKFFGVWGPWHMIPLEHGFEGKELRLKIFSDDDRIGIFGKVAVGSRFDHLKYLVTGTLDQFVIGVFLLFIGLFAFILFIKNPREKALLAFGGMAFTWAVFSISLNPIKQLFFNHPPVWSYILILALLPSGAFDFLLIESFFGSGYKSLIRRIWQMHFVYALFASAAVILAPTSMSSIVRLHEYVSLFEAFIVVAIFIWLFKKGFEGKIFILGYAGVAVFPFIGLFIDMNIIHTAYKPHWGSLIFTFTICLILIRRFAEINRRADVDSLTGLYNRRYFFETAQREYERSIRYNAKLSLIVLDVDNFKAFNDSYGHSLGDRVLKIIAERCLQSVRKSDMVGRFGGEELVILLPQTDIHTAGEIAERLRRCIMDERIYTDKHEELFITVSIGVSSLTLDTKNLNSLFEKADLALYEAKSRGRNCVAVRI